MPARSVSGSNLNRLTGDFVQPANRFLGILWGDVRESNPRHLEPQSSALPTELTPPPFRPSVAGQSKEARILKDIRIACLALRHKTCRVPS